MSVGEYFLLGIAVGFSLGVGFAILVSATAPK